GRIPVGFPERGGRGAREVAAGVGKHLGLLRLAVGRQVARDKDGVHLAGDLREDGDDAAAFLPAAVNVARRGDPDGLSFRHPGQEGTPIVPMSNESLPAMLETLKRSAGALREAGVPFMLGGGLACWVRGGPESDHDLDLMVKPEDAEQALA